MEKCQQLSEFCLNAHSPTVVTDSLFYLTIYIKHIVTGPISSAFRQLLIILYLLFHFLLNLKLCLCCGEFWQLRSRPTRPPWLMWELSVFVASASSLKICAYKIGEHYFYNHHSVTRQYCDMWREHQFAEIAIVKTLNIGFVFIRGLNTIFETFILLGKVNKYKPGYHENGTLIQKE